MKKTAILILAAGAIAILGSCDNDNKTTWEEYADWREANEVWVNQYAATPGFTKVVPSYSPKDIVYVRNVTDPTPNAGNLVPYYTSTVKVNYELHDMDSTLLDKAAGYECNLSSQSLITGWAISIMQMHVGDSIEAILPYNVAYGPSGTSGIKPYTALRFNIKLVDIPYYEIAD